VKTLQDGKSAVGSIGDRESRWSRRLLFEITRVFEVFNHVARVIVNANHGGV
jgi:hypothetical protein